MPVQARIKYLLSEQGRRDSLRRGGNGRHIQEVRGPVDDTDLDVFQVDDDGNAFFDATSLEYDPSDPPAIVPASKGRLVTTPVGPDEIHWDVVPSWEDLITVAKGIKAYNDEQAAYEEEDRQLLKHIAEEFINNPSARATSLERDHVIISDRRFEKFTQTYNEARKRWESDQEELKKSNRATLREWIIRNGTDNQRQRLAAELLPWKEAYETVEANFFKPLEGFQLYRRFEPEEVTCVCPGEFKCDPKFQSVDATEVTADEWDQFAKLRAVVPGATFQFREHRAKCQSAVEPEIRRGVIVKFSLGQLTFKREFALTADVEVPF
jgi:hypothetical protein